MMGWSGYSLLMSLMRVCHCANSSSTIVCSTGLVSPMLCTRRSRLGSALDGHV